MNLKLSFQGCYVRSVALGGLHCATYCVTDVHSISSIVLLAVPGNLFTLLNIVLCT